MSFAVNPYAKVESNGKGDSLALSSWEKDEADVASMPSLEWRKRFLVRFSNMRTALATLGAVQRPSDFPNSIPRGRSPKRWYRFLHGRDIQLEVEYDDEVEEVVPAGGVDENNTSSSHQVVEPSEALLQQFSAVSDVLSLMHTGVHGD